MTITDFFICALAASAIVDVWFNGSILADLRKLVEVKADWCEDPAADQEPETLRAMESAEYIHSWVDYCPCLAARMLSCAFCMSHHTPLWVFTWYFGVSYLPATVCEVLRLPVYILAASRLMNLVTTFSGKPYQEKL
jgi:hypothetical protein